MLKMQENLKTLMYTIKQLDDDDFAIWDDCYGKTEFAIIGSIHPIISQSNSKFIVSEYLNYCIPNNYFYDNIVTIGGFPVHNKGKIEAQDEEIDVATIPIPLSNDSFGTNRCSKGEDETTASFQCIYPSKVFFCVEDLLAFGVAHSINGIGEFVGLYYSYIDYCLIHNYPISDTILHFILCSFREQIKLFNEKNHTELIRKIAIGLVFKCLIMRTSDSHEIGCEIDHFFARMFEDTYSFAHGKSVYLGSILSSIILTTWGKWGLNTKELIKSGMALGIISRQDIYDLTKIDILQFVSEALQKRPLRATNLRKIDATIIASSFNLFKETWAISK